MIKKLTLFLSVLFSVFSASASGTILIRDVTYEVDTLFHAQVGPGTTQTSLLLKGPTTNLRAFYLTIDIKNPLVSIKTVCATDKVAGNETTSGMAKRKSTAGNEYFGGVNGDFFATSGTASNGKSIVGTPTNACIVNGEIYKTSNSSKQFAINELGVPFVGQASFYSSTATSGSNQVLFKGVNLNSPDNGITVYTSRFYGVTNQTSKAGSCAEVTAKLADGESFVAGKSCKMIITSTATSTGDLAIPTDGFVIHGRGTSTTGGNMGALDFVNSLQVGDEVTLNSKILIDGTEITPFQMISGNPRTLGDGVTLDTEGERDDASAYHPRTGIGYGDNKSKIIMMVVDGRSTISSGVRTSQLADIMKYAGATDAINLDGGGSSAIYTQALGVRNHPSDGTERADGNAVFAVSSAPEDNVVAKIAFVDWAMAFPKYGVYQPKFFGYNQYGKLIDTDLQGVSLSCPPELGRIENLNTFVGDGNGTYALTGTYGALNATIPVTIVTTDQVSMRMDSVICNGYDPYTIEVMATMGENLMPISSSALSWRSDDPTIVAVNSKTGEITGINNGETLVHGTVGSYDGSIKVKVQKPTSRVMPIDPNMDVTSWKITQAGGTDLTIEPLENGMKLSYTGASGRAPSIKIAKKIELWSLPDTIRIRINPGDAPIKKATIVTSVNGGSIIANDVPVPEANKLNVINLATSTWCDSKDMINYPICLNYILFDMNAATTGKQYTIEMPGIEAVYLAVPSGVTNTIIDDNLSIYPNPVTAGSTAYIKTAIDGESVMSVFDAAARCLVKSKITPTNGVIEIPTNNLSQGIYFVTLEYKDFHKTLKLIVR